MELITTSVDEWGNAYLIWKDKDGNVFEEIVYAEGGSSFSPLG